MRGLRFPIQVRDKARAVQNTVATIGMFVDLPKEFKGTHMSRFIEVLNAHGNVIHVENITDILYAMQEKFQAATSHLEIEFPYFMVKQAPVTGKESVMDYMARFDAAACHKEILFLLTVKANVTTLCPCSKAIAAYGAHNQRGEVTVQIRSRKAVWIEDLIAIIESSASSELYALLKRQDEKAVTERAYDNPVFVEDLVRNVAAQAQRASGCDVVQGGGGKPGKHPQPQRLRLHRETLIRSAESRTPHGEPRVFCTLARQTNHSLLYTRRGGA